MSRRDIAPTSRLGSFADRCGRSPAHAGSRCRERAWNGEGLLYVGGSDQRRMNALPVDHFPTGVLA